VRRWPLFLIAAPAAVSIWAGWVGLGELCGFGVVAPLPGILPGFHLNTAITLPVGVEAYGAYALGAWLTPGTPQRARAFARRSAVGALLLGMLGQVVYHLLAAAGAVRAPWPVVVLVSCLPVVTLGFGAGLAHLLRTDGGDQAETAGITRVRAEAAAMAEEAAQAAEARIQAAAGEAAQARDLAAKAAGEARARVHVLEQSLAAERSRAETAERELRAARTDHPRTGEARTDPVDREAVVAGLADQIRDAISSGERWAPDYDALMQRTGFRRSWCEKAVRDARTAATFPARTDTEALVLANGHPPGGGGPEN
jgi:hypothetical protein